MHRVIFRGEEMIGEASDNSLQILKKTGPNSPPYVAPFHGTKGSTLPSSSVHRPEKVMFGHASLFKPTRRAGPTSRPGILSPSTPVARVCPRPFVATRSRRPPHVV